MRCVRDGCDNVGRAVTGLPVTPPQQSTARRNAPPTLVHQQGRCRTQYCFEPRRGKRLGERGGGGGGCTLQLITTLSPRKCAVICNAKSRRRAGEQGLQTGGYSVGFRPGRLRPGKTFYPQQLDVCPPKPGLRHYDVERRAAATAQRRCRQFDSSQGGRWPPEPTPVSLAPISIQNETRLVVHFLF